MDSFFVVVVPYRETRRDIKNASRERVDTTEFAETLRPPSPQAVEDAEKMPLWRWFISSK